MTVMKSDGSVGCWNADLRNSAAEGSWFVSLSDSRLSLYLSDLIVPKAVSGRQLPELNYVMVPYEKTICLSVGLETDYSYTKAPLEYNLPMGYI